MSRHSITLTVNRIPMRREVEAHRTLVEVLRDELDLIGAKEACGSGECGACTVIVNGRPLRSCLVLAVAVDGATITTIEGLAVAGRPDPLQQAFIDAGAVQCGYCTPGFILAARVLLERDPDPDDDAIARAFSGHLCRCTGYASLFEAVRLVARRRKALGA